MNIKIILASIVLLILVIFGGNYLFNHSPNNNSSNTSAASPPPKEVARQTQQVKVNPDQTPSLEANKLPEFVYSLADKKFDSIVNASSDQIKKLATVQIVHSVFAEDSINADISVDKNKRELLVRPQDVPNFTPGLYKLSLSLRTIEGVVDVSQDFSWGVIAVNTNKSIYAPGEVAKIGIGVLDNKGETQCITGFAHVDDLSMEVTDPSGNVTKYSIKDKSITGSDKCGATTVTNDADFQATYTNTTAPGIYEMKITAEAKGAYRSITDYFKVDPNVAFDVERTSFPTRIYPLVTYPVTFSVTAKSDYKGMLTDIVPKFFSIEHISDKGMAIDYGNFKKISWQVSLKANKTQTFTYFINFPRVSPEFYLLGPIQIGNFQEARQWQIASDAVNSTSGVVSMEDNGSSNTWSRVWTGTTWNPPLTTTDPTSMSTAPTDSRWFKEVSSPKTGEKIVALVDNLSPDAIYVFTWSGASWVQSKHVSLTGVTTADSTRGFDVAYEELSGDAIVVYSDYTNAQLLYWVRVNGAWAGLSTDPGAPAGTAFGSFKRWIRLQPQFGSDNILVGYVSNTNGVGAMIWDGSTNKFGNQFSDASGTAAANAADQSFDIAWETSSNIGQIFWGDATKHIIEREYSSNTWQSETTAATLTGNNVDWLFAAADPVDTSNYISVAVQEATTPKCDMGVWNGSTLRFSNTTVQCVSAATNNLISTAFENNTDQAMFAFIVATAGASQGELSWRTWNPTDDFSPIHTEAGAVPTGAIEGIQLYSDLNTTTMMALYHDNSASSPITANDCQLWDREWDGNTWSSLNAKPVFDDLCASADNDTEPYGFGFDRNLETLAAYKWFNNVNGDTGAGLSALATQDTSYTLTSANQQFRLRLLLYYPDSLASSALRQYKLQYVDPGLGTCDNPSGGTPSIYTDVPSSGGTTISFAASGSLNSGDNIATNSADPSYQGKLVQYQDFQKSNTFTNSRTNMLGDQTGIWDFSLIDNTTFDRDAQTYCFRVARSNDLVLRISKYPQINTAALNDVLIRGGTLVRLGTTAR